MNEQPTVKLVCLINGTAKQIVLRRVIGRDPVTFDEFVAKEGANLIAEDRLAAFRAVPGIEDFLKSGELSVNEPVIVNDWQQKIADAKTTKQLQRLLNTIGHNDEVRQAIVARYQELHPSEESAGSGVTYV